MKKPVRNLFSDDDPETLARDLEAISKSRAKRSAETDFESYLDFLEWSSEFFGFTNERKKDKFKMNGDPPLL